MVRQKAFTCYLVQLNCIEIIRSFFVSDPEEAQEQAVTSAGKNLGLTVILDGHMDKVEPMTITSDFNGFKALITPPGEFPQPSIKGFSIKPGTFNGV